MKKCPLCGKTYTAHPAISRKDNATEICPMCGMLEALDAAGISATVADDGWLVFDGVESDVHVSDLDRTYPAPDPEHDREVMRLAHESALELGRVTRG